MCGIAGFRSIDAQLAPDSLRRITQAMTATLAHRGPDDADLWIDAEAGLALGHRRLAIIDLSAAGRQPMASACGRYVITYNGEIYNFRELRAQLEQHGHAFRGHSDTEVLLAALAEWGVAEALGRLNGMFAFALWDREQRRLTLARDRAGKKPLYYGWCGDSFLFGSELKALRAHPAFDARIDRDALGLLVQYSWMPAPYSIYAGIRQLPAGTLLAVDADDRAGVAAPEVYWSAHEVAVRGSRAPAAMSLEAATDALEEVLRDAVACRMIADVSLGAFLSGGIDSSVVVALMQSVSSKPVQTFSIGFHEEKYNEAAHAKAIAQHLRTDHTELYVTPDDCLEVIPRLPTLYDEPFADYSQIPTFLVSRLARSKVTVALSGDGGDELFGGYKDYAKNLRDWQLQLAVWRHCPPALRRGMANLLTEVGQSGRHMLGIDDLAEAKAGALRTRLARKLGKLKKRGQRILPFDSGAALHARLRARVERAEELVLGARLVPSGLTDPDGWASVADPLLGMMLVDFTTYMADDILTKVDRASMGVSLEVRCPLLDPRVIELAWSLPSSMRMGPNGGKHILQNLLARHVPRALFERPKQGFNIPIEEWLRGPLRDWAEALLDEHRLHQEGYLRPRAVRRIWLDHLSGHREHSSPLWSLLTFQAWHETWMKGDHAAKADAAA
jgi:asparagine synthase (glutamine-hydrolysing)